MGNIITFYSYKGGVGRSMCLANAGYLLSKWGYSVLMIDWDLEAPGLESFFRHLITNDVSHNKGLIDLIHEQSAHPDKLQKGFWKSYVSPLLSTPGKLELITAGRRLKDSAGNETKEYYEKVRQFDVKGFYENQGGKLIERLRTEWKQDYDFILVDSRTGITEVGGICTIALPDILVLLFTATIASYNGIADVAIRAKRAQEELRVERLKLLTLPVLCRVDGSEKDLTKKWIEKFITGDPNIPYKLGDIYRNWLPDNADIHPIINQTKVPHVAFYSFGEKLAVEEKNFESDSQGIGYIYLSIVGLLATGLNFPDLLIYDRSKLLRLASKSYLDELKENIYTYVKEELSPLSDIELRKAMLHEVKTTKPTSNENLTIKAGALFDKSFEKVLQNTNLTLSDLNAIKVSKRAGKGLGIPGLMKNKTTDRLSDHFAIRIYYRIKDTDKDCLFMINPDLKTFIINEISLNEKIAATITSHTNEPDTCLDVLRFYFSDLAKNITDKLFYLLNDKELSKMGEQVAKYVLTGIIPASKQREAPASKTPDRKTGSSSKRTYILMACSLLLSIFGIVYTTNRFLTQKNVKAFKNSLAALNSKTGVELKEAECLLANYDKAVNNEFVKQMKDSLRKKCEDYSVVKQELEQSDSILQQINNSIVNSQVYNSESARQVLQAARSIDENEGKIKEKIGGLTVLDPKKDSVEIRKVKDDTARLNQEIKKLITTFPLLKKASDANVVYVKAETKKDSLLNISPVTTPSKSKTAWFKEGYFLQFDSIKVILRDQSNNSIKVTICKMVGAAPCKNSIVTDYTIVEAKPAEIKYTGGTITLTLDRIGRAGKNPFTRAAYITYVHDP